VRSSCASSVVRVEEIAPGLGARRFFCLELDDPARPRLIARVEPDASAHELAPEPQLTPLLACLAAAGLPVPETYGHEADDAIVLLEDLGTRSLESAVRDASPSTRRRLYAEACAIVPQLQRLTAPPREGAEAAGVEAFTRHLDAALIATKATKFCAWTLPELLGRGVRDAEREVVDQAFRAVASEVGAAPQRLAHRDYKAANLHFRTSTRTSARTPDAGGESLVMIDLQGAFMAPPEYDLVCLLRDSHVALPEAEVREHAERTRVDLPDAPAGDGFWRRFDLLTLIRVAKDVSHYIHAASQRRDRRYLRFVRSGLANLGAAATRSAERDARYAPIADLIAGLPDDLPGAAGHDT